MTGVFQDIEFGGRFPEFSADHPRRKRGDELLSEIDQQRNKLRKFGGWEENWGAYRELHFPPVKRRRFGSASRPPMSPSMNSKS